MSGIWNVCLVLVSGKNRNNSGNSHIVHVVGIDKLMSPIELFQCWHQLSSLISLGQQSCSKQFSSFNKVLIL